MDPAPCSSGSDPRFVGDPVDTFSGAVVDRMMDFRLTGPIDFRWVRNYDSSRSHRSFSMGRGCAHDFDSRLTVERQGLVLEQALGRTLRFDALAADGDSTAAHGFLVTRLTPHRYRVMTRGAPAQVFDFEAGASRVRLSRLIHEGSQVRFRYDADQRLVAIVDAVNRQIVVDEDDQGRITRLAFAAEAALPERLIMSYRYDVRGCLIATENGDGHGYSFNYDDAHRMVERRGRRGFRFQFKYDEQGRCTLAVGDDRHYGVALDYAASGRLTEVTRPDGGVWRYRFTRQGEIEHIVDPSGGTAKFFRDASGRRVLDVDPNGNALRYVHDVAGAPLARVDALGHRSDLPEDPNAPEPFDHRVAANGLEYVYGDALWPIDDVTLPASTDVAALALAPHCLPLVQMRAPGLGPAAAAAFEVPPLGILWWPQPRRGRVFNEFGKLVAQNDEAGRTRRWNYDESGNENELVDFDGGRWLYDFGTWHFLRRIVDPNGAEVRLDYTPYGEVAAFEDAGGTRSEYGYDTQDHLVEVRRHGQVRDTYTRDAVGNLIAKHDAGGREMLRLDIGPANLLLKRTLASGDVHEFTYDASGRPLTARTLTESLAFAYDAQGRCILEQRDGWGLECLFDATDRLQAMTLFGRFAIRHQREDDLITITDPGGMAHQIHCVASGIVERRHGTGTRETAQFDNLGRCLFTSVQSTSGLVLNRRYHWSGEGELRRIEASGAGDITHAYDAAHRLAQRVDHSTGSVDTYTFDAAGNLLAQPGLGDAAHASGNRLIAANGCRFTFDERHHVQTRSGPDGVTRYSYDSRDLLVRIDDDEGAWEASYDPFGRRTRKTWNGTPTRYFWNDDQLVAEMAGDGRLRLYVYADALAMTPMLFIDYDSIRSEPAAGRRHIVFSDQVGCPIRIEDNAGLEVWSAAVSPFGRIDVTPGSTIEFNLRFPGHYHDVETGLHCNRFRYYDPTLGRYLQSDPWGIAGGWNLYAYRPNPLLESDVRGLGEENKKKGKPCPDEEGTLSKGAQLAKAQGLPNAPKGHHYADIGGVPRLKRNPGYEGTKKRINDKGKIVNAPKEEQYPRASHDQAARDKVFDDAKDNKGRVECPCGKAVKSSGSDDMQMGHKPDHQYATDRDKAIDSKMSQADWQAQQKDLSNYRPEHPECNQSHKFEHDDD